MKNKQKKSASFPFKKERKKEREEEEGKDWALLVFGQRNWSFLSPIVTKQDGLKGRKMITTTKREEYEPR